MTERLSNLLPEGDQQFYDPEKVLAGLQQKYPDAPPAALEAVAQHIIQVNASLHRNGGDPFEPKYLSEQTQWESGIEGVKMGPDGNWKYQGSTDFGGYSFDPPIEAWQFLSGPSDEVVFDRDIESMLEIFRRNMDASDPANLTGSFGSTDF